MTANAMAGDKEKALAAGMNDHVAKPIDVNGELFSALSKYIEPKGENASSPITKESASQTSIPELDGIDTQKGLARVGGKQSLYMKILRKFRSSEGETVNKIKQALAEKDRETAIRLAHTLKRFGGEYWC